MNAGYGPLLSAGQLLLGVALGALAVSGRGARKRHREIVFHIRDAIMRDRDQIAHELHDVVTHHLTVMVASASAAKRRLTLDMATTTLSTIETSGRDALQEMRRMLGRLQAEETEPPGLDKLPALVTRVEQAGLPVRLTVRGDRRTLPGDVDENAYRIVQEALTNALKHAGPTRARVEIGYRSDAVQLRIYDFGVGAMPGSDGYGLDGMRHRVARLGGEIAIGTGPNGGFRVAVTLPVSDCS